MEDSKSVVSSGAYGIPKWIMKKGMRYEVDDFIVSPPSLDDGGFLRLRYGRTTHEPSLEGAGQDGGMTVEVKDDTLQFSSDPPPTNTTITIGPGGLSVEASPSTTPLTTPESKLESPEVHPLLVLPMNFGGEPKFVLKVDTPDSSDTNKEFLGFTASAASKEDTTKETVESVPASHSTTLLEKVQSLSLNTTPSQSEVSSPGNSPFTTPKSSPTFPRKRMGMMMEPPRKISAHSYFCTKQYLNSLRETSDFKQEVVASSQPKHVEEGSLPPQALNPKMMGQRRRHPKPSALREMNFWAPTSM